MDKDEKQLTYDAFTRCHDLRDKLITELEHVDVIIKALSEKLDSLKEKKE